MGVIDRSLLETLYPDLESRSSLDLCYRCNCVFTSVAPGTFAGLSNVTILQLPKNRLTSFAELRNLRNLTALSLCGNSMAAIAPGMFAGLPRLTDLDLSLNSITDIAPGTFAELSSLTRLDLSNNKLASLAPGAFAGLPNLVELFLNANYLTSLAPGTFSRLSKLTDLYLSRNRLTFIAPGAFAELSPTTWLILHENQLTALTPDALLCKCHAASFLTKQHTIYIPNSDPVVEAMAALYPNGDLHQSLVGVPQLQELTAFKPDHYPPGYRGDSWCSPLRVRLLLLCKYVRDAYELETYRYCSAEQLQGLFHLRARLAGTARNPLKDRLPETLLRHLWEW